jgi:hypothetical protein
MDGMKRIGLLLGGLLLFPGLVAAQFNFSSARSLNQVQSAWTLEQGLFSVSGLGRIFGQNTTAPSGGALTVYDASGRLFINYGLGKKLEISFAPLLYQDANIPDAKVNAPDDFVLGLKLGSLGSPIAPWSYAFQLASRIPTGKNHNLPFEPYSAGRASFGVMTMLSFSRDPLYPERSTNFHVNLGYWNHNDVGAELIRRGDPSTEPHNMSQEIQFGVGVMIPKRTFDFSFELYGAGFLQAPPSSAYSRENYLYFTPLVFYKAARWFTLKAGVDLRVVNTADETLYAPAQGGVSRTITGSQPNYPAWRLNVGTTFSWHSSRLYRVRNRDMLMQKAQTRRELFEQIIEDQRATESAEAELERIRTERIRVERELERLRRILEREAEVQEAVHELESK